MYSVDPDKEQVLLSSRHIGSTFLIIRYLIIFDKLSQSNYPRTHSQLFNAVGTHVLKELSQFTFIYFIFIYTINETVLLNAQSKP